FTQGASHLQIPAARGAVERCADDSLSIRAKPRRENATIVLERIEEPPARLAAPDSDRVVMTAGRNDFRSIGTQLHRCNAVFMLQRLGHHFAGLAIPDPDFFVCRLRYHARAVRGKLRGVYSAVVQEFDQHLAGADIPDS